MFIKKITIQNFRGIDNLTPLEISRINTFVGKNDSGKSAILQAIGCFFDEKKFNKKDIFKAKPDDEKTVIEISFLPPTEIDNLALDSQGQITIKKEFELIDGKIKVNSFYKCFDFRDERYQDLWNKKEADLNQIITNLGEVPERSGRGKKNVIRIEQIKNSVPSDVVRENRYNPLGNYIKNLDKIYGSVTYPEYSLFTAEQDLNIEATNFQSQFKPIISAYFYKTETQTAEIEAGLKEDLAIEFEEIRKFMKKNVSGLKKFNPTTEFDWTKSLKKFDLNLEFEGHEFDVSISHKGTGFKRLLMVAYFEHLASKQTMREHIFAIEEPETYLHPSAQEDLLKSIIKISENSQFFITTHSPIFAGATNGENSILVSKNASGVSQYNRGSEDIIQKIISELGIKPDHNLIRECKFLVFAEGADDVKFLNIAARTLLDKDLSKDGIVCLIGGGSSLSNYADLDLFKQIHGEKYAVIVDGDNGDERKQIEKVKIKSKCDSDGALFKQLSKREIENFCPPEKIKECYISEIRSKEGAESINPRITKIDKTTLTIDDDTDVEKYLKDQGINGFKNGMNIKVFESMDISDWESVDGDNEIKTFLESVYERIER